MPETSVCIPFVNFKRSGPKCDTYLIDELVCVNLKKNPQNSANLLNLTPKLPISERTFRRRLEENFGDLDPTTCRLYQM